MIVPYFPFDITRGRESNYKVTSPYEDGDFKLNSASVQLLELCNGYNTLEEIVRKLSNHYSSTISEMTTLTERFINEWEKMGLLWIRGERMRWFYTPPPSSIFWELTAECNLKCLHCVVSADKKLEGELTTKECRKLLDELQKLGVTDIAFSGGEPLLREDFLDIAYYAKKRNFRLQIATNGILITPSIANEFKKMRMDIQISLDGSNAEIYEGFRGRKHAFDMAIKGIETIRGAGINLTIGMVITRLNVDDVPNMLKLVEYYGVKYFRLIPFIPYGRGSKNKSLELEPSQVKELTTYLLKKRQEVPFEIITMEFEETLKEPPKYSIDKSQPSACGGAIHYCTITPLGEVLPCHYFAGVKTENVKHNSFIWIWHHSRFLNYFRSIRIREIKGYCKNCEWLAVCRGGCKAANFSHGSLFRSNRHCWVAAENEKNQPQEVS